MIELRAFGTGEIHTPVATIKPSQSMVFAAALYLILERRAGVSRERLAGLLWPTIASPHRAHRLRQTLLQLKKLGVGVDADRTRIILSTDQVLTDLDGVADRDVRLGGSFEMLAGYDPQFSPSFSDWLDAKRRTVHSAATGCLLRAIEFAKSRADWETVEELASKCLALDALNESAILARAEAAAMRGCKRQALSILDGFLKEVGDTGADLRIPAEVLRRRIIQRIPEPSPRRKDHLPFIGRETEAEVLSRRLAQMRLGSGGVVLVTGEPGIGKSRLCAEFGRLALLGGTEVRQAACRPADVARPLSLFVGLVSQLRELPGALGCAPETLALLKRLTDFEPSPSENFRPTDSQALFGRVRTALFDLLDSLADEQPIVLLVDDVQWMDEPSARLLAQMAEWAETERVLFLLTARPGASSFLDAFDQNKLPTVSLPPLARSDALSVIRSLREPTGEDRDTEFEEWCLSVAEGNPFFLQELGRQWIETPRKYAAPPSVVKVLETRVSRLSREALQVLQSSAILSDLATLNRIQSVLGIQPHQLIAAVEELVASAMLRPAAEALAALEGQIQPRHELLASVATGKLSALSLSFLHRRSADVLEAEITGANKDTGLLWACANHSLCAGDKERALSYSVSCAEHMLAMGLAKESSDAFERSLSFCTSDEQRLNLLRRLAFSLQTDAKWDASKEILEKCVSLNARIDSHAPRHNEYELLLLEARYYSSLEYRSLLEDFKPCVESDEATPSHRVRAGIKALKLATDIGSKELIESLYQHLAPILHSDGVLPEDALELGIVYRTLASESDIPVHDFSQFLAAGKPDFLEYFQRLITIISSCRITGRYKEGLTFVGEAVSFAASRNLPSYVAQAQLAAVQLHVAASQYQAADSTLKKMRESFCAPENARLREEPHFMEARISLECGDPVRCEFALSKISNVSGRYSPSRTAYFFALHVGLAVLQEKSQEVLLPLVGQLAEAYRRSRSLGLQDFETYSLYKGLVALRQPVEAIETVSEYARVYRRCKWRLSPRLEAVLETANNANPGTQQRGSQEGLGFRSAPTSSTPIRQRAE
jgi:DNA-binding SARP family transcriptional activator